MEQISSSAPCPCGSQRKFKKCCMPLEGAALAERTAEKLALVRNAEGELVVTAAEIIDSSFKEEDKGVVMALFAGEFAPILREPETGRFIPGNDYAFDVFRTCFAPLSLFIERTLPGEPANFVESVSRVAPHLQTLRHRTFVEAVRRARYHILAIEDLLPGSQIKFLDIETNERFIVTDYRLSECGTKGFLLLASLFQMWGDHYLLGSLPQPLPGAVGPLLVRMIEAASVTLGSQDHPAAPPVEVSRDFVRRTLFLSALASTMQQVSKPPEVRNMEGHIIEEVCGTYRLRCPPEEVVAVLAAERLFKVEETTPHTLIAWMSAKGSAATKRMGGDVLRGRITVTAENLYFEVNSNARATALRGRLTRLLGNRITLERIRTGFAPIERDERPPLDPNSPEIMAALTEHMRQRSERWVDTAIPALGGMTPRAAASDPKMRGALEALLLSMEDTTKRLENEPIKTMDVDLIRTLLSRR